MALNPMELLKIRKVWNTFVSEHPKFLPYFGNLKSSGYLSEGSVIDMIVTDKEGKSVRYNMRLTKNDLELMRVLAELGEE